MGRSVPNAGHETFLDGKIGLYCGVENGPGGLAGFHTATDYKRRLTRQQFQKLDNTIRFMAEQDVLALMSRDAYKYFWRRTVKQLNRLYPKEAAVTVFIRAWVRTV